MASLRPLVAASLAFCLLSLTCPVVFSVTSALGILTQAYEARVDEAVAYPGLSIFDGEQLSTDFHGHVGVRAGRSILTLAGNTTVSVFHVTNGIHVDLTARSVYSNGVGGEAAEVHIGEALLRTASPAVAQASFSLLAPKVLQVAAQKGGLNFNYRDEYRFLLEGQTYRIYLDAPAEPQVDTISGPPKPGISGKVAYFIVGAGVGGAAAWGIHQVATPGNLPISPDKP